MICGDNNVMELRKINIQDAIAQWEYTTALPVDENGYITIFDGKTFDGWRGYGKDKVPAKWTIEDGCIKFNGTGGGEAQDADGGDLIFAHGHILLYFTVRNTPFGEAGLLDNDMNIDFAAVTTPNDRVAGIATLPLTTNEQWRQLAVN